MSRYYCRQYDREGTEREVEALDADFAPDEYAHRFLQSPEEGDVTFIEVRDEQIASQWVLWRVEVLSREGGVICFVTKRVTSEEAQREIEENHVQAN